jgi:tRNA A22 N-methylase
MAAMLMWKYYNSVGLWSLILLIVVRPSTSFSSKRLSSRLEEVFHLCSSAIITTTKPIVVADIGADHAQLSLALVQKGVADRAIAIDRCSSPLEMGQENARKATLFDRVDFRLGNGLEPLCPTDDVHVVCVAGMGARTITSILQQQGGELSSSPTGGADNQRTLLQRLQIQHLVLQPVSPHPQYMIPLRRWLTDQNWHIQNETLLQKGKRFYLTLLASPRDDRTGDLCSVLSKDNDQNLVLPRAIQKRVHAHLEELSKSNKATLTSSQVKEINQYYNYVKHYTEWAISTARSDTYDRDVGISRDVIASILQRELHLVESSQSCFL